MADMSAIRRRLAKQPSHLDVDALRHGARQRAGAQRAHIGLFSKGVQVHVDSIGRGERTASPISSRLKKG